MYMAQFKIMKMFQAGLFISKKIGKTTVKRSTRVESKDWIHRKKNEV